MKKLIKEKRKKILRIILLFSILLLILLLSGSLLKIIVLASFIISNLALALAKRIMPKFALGKYLYGIELIMFCTVLTSITFGPLTGLVMGCFLMAINYIAERRISQYFIITIIMYALIGYFAYFFRAYDIILLGITLTIAYNIIVNIAVGLLGANKTTMLAFSVVNITFNILVFTSFGRIVKVMLS